MNRDAIMNPLTLNEIGMDALSKALRSGESLLRFLIQEIGCGIRVGRKILVDREYFDKWCSRQCIKL